MKKIFVIIASAIFLLSFVKTNHNAKSVPVSHADTSKPKKYNYFFTISVSPVEWQRSMDTLNIVMNKIGVDMLGSQIELYKAAYARQINNLGAKIKVDSVEIK